MSEAMSAYSVEERIVQAETVWVAIRARGAEWSWLTPAEAARIGQQWVDYVGFAVFLSFRPFLLQVGDGFLDVGRDLRHCGKSGCQGKSE